MNPKQCDSCGVVSDVVRTSQWLMGRSSPEPTTFTDCISVAVAMCAHCVREETSSVRRTRLKGAGRGVLVAVAGALLILGAFSRTLGSAPFGIPLLLFVIGGFAALFGALMAFAGVASIRDPVPEVMPQAKRVAVGGGRDSAWLASTIPSQEIDCLVSRRPVAETRHMFDSNRFFESSSDQVTGFSTRFAELFGGQSGSARDQEAKDVEAATLFMLGRTLGRTRVFLLAANGQGSPLTDAFIFNDHMAMVYDGLLLKPRPGPPYEEAAATKEFAAGRAEGIKEGIEFLTDPTARFLRAFVPERRLRGGGDRRAC